MKPQNVRFGERVEREQRLLPSPPAAGVSACMHAAADRVDASHPAGRC